ncbi:MAG: hypothetical protein KDB56_04120 [Mycobacterium sp.]|nr:hypothetical protein [Mycobacterium sp.]
MVSDRAFHRFALIAGSSALACMGILALGTHGVDTPLTGVSADAPLAPADPGGTTGTASPSYAPSHPVDCTDPNNAINCQSPPLDSPLVVGTAEPGSPFRD